MDKIFVSHKASKVCLIQYVFYVKSKISNIIEHSKKIGKGNIYCNETKIILIESLIAGT